MAQNIKKWEANRMHGKFPRSLSEKFIKTYDPRSRVTVDLSPVS
jgi:hypothetical protein